MEKSAFDRVLQGLSRRKPFRAFTVELEHGESIRVDHREALVSRAGVAVYLNAQGVPSWFDHQGVTRISGAADRSKPS